MYKIIYNCVHIYIYIHISIWTRTQAGTQTRPHEQLHRWNRNPRPQPHNSSKSASLIYFSWYWFHVSELVIWGSSWGRGFRFHWLQLVINKLTERISLSQFASLKKPLYMVRGDHLKILVFRSSGTMSSCISLPPQFPPRPTPPLAITAGAWPDPDAHYLVQHR